MFDIGAARRRFGPLALLSSSLARQLIVYCSVLRDIRHGDIYSNGIKEILWAAYFMMAENDGRNRVQLERAGIDGFIYRFIMMRLSEGRGEHRGWPVENQENSLALWIMAMTYDEGVNTLQFIFPI
jgi:hypothetical protein